MNDQDEKTKGRRRKGRPSSVEAPKILVPTRCPKVVYQYLKATAALQNLTIGELLNEIIRRFCLERPWISEGSSSGLKWRVPKTTTSRSEGVATGLTGWVQVNLELTEAVARDFEYVRAGADLSKAAVAYTAIYWYVQYVKPPGQ